MTTAAKRSIAFRLGRALGSVARFCMHDRNSKVRWVKRAVLAAISLVVLLNSLNWLASVAIWIGTIALAVYGYRSPGKAWTDDEWERFEAPYGRDIYGTPVDIWGRPLDAYGQPSED